MSPRRREVRPGDDTSGERWPRAIAAVSFLAVTAVVFLWIRVFGHTAIWVGEGGIVETLSAVFWGLAAATCFAISVRVRSLRLEWALGGAVLAILCARELDIQKSLADWNAANPSNYLDPELPLSERFAIAALFVAPSLAVLLAFVWRMWRRFLDAWRAGRAWPRDFVIWGLMLAVSSRLDKLHKLKETLDLGPAVLEAGLVLEECLEMTLALYVLLVVGTAGHRAWRAAGRA